MKMKNSKDEFTPEQKTFGKSVVVDPVLFAEHILGVKLWDHEIRHSAIH